MLLSKAAFIVADELEDVKNLARIDVYDDYKLEAITIRLDMRIPEKPEVYRIKHVLSMVELSALYPDGEILIRRTVREMLTELKIKCST